MFVNGRLMDHADNANHLSIEEQDSQNNTN